MTAFGPGNHAVPAKAIIREAVTDLPGEIPFNVTADLSNHRYRLSGRVNSASTDGPLYRTDASLNTGDDLIHARKAL